MTTYKIIIYFKFKNISKIFTWKSKSFTSKKRVIFSLKEIKDDIYNTIKYNPNRLDNHYDYKSINTLNDIIVISIGAYYKSDTEWYELNANIYCNNCGRLLEDEESIKRHYGPICWKKIQNQQNENLNIFLN